MEEVFMDLFIVRNGLVDSLLLIWIIKKNEIKLKFTADCHLSLEMLQAIDRQEVIEYYDDDTITDE